MSELFSNLQESLRTGFIDQTFPSKKEFHPQFLSNDKIHGKKVLTTIQKELNECEEFWFSVAFVTKSGVISLINLLRELEERNIQGKILVSQYQNFTEPEALKTLLTFKNIELKILVKGEFHAKGYLFKKGATYNLIIGSSNFTANALSSNKEWNLKISATRESKIINDAVREFSMEFNNAVPVNDSFIELYEKIYTSRLSYLLSHPNLEDTIEEVAISPNMMQEEALASLNDLRNKNKNKALLISATGTGKTYLSAFDIKKVNPKTFLFIVHRNNIAKEALNSFKRVFGNRKRLGMYSGDQKETEAEYLFATIQTLSREYYLKQFKPDQFEYIVFDETHRIGGETYQRIQNYFKPKFLLGMTATPERTDGFDVYKEFDYNIAYEIRLHKALEENMLCPFHYFGVTDIEVNGELLDDNADFNKLTTDERVDKILSKARFYGTDSGTIRGLVFCRTVEECKTLSEKFNLRGIKSVSLSGSSSEQERVDAIDSLESDDQVKRIDYIFSVDIFNEGIDIPRVNQIILLRPTQSAIVFVQQIGRGLRKTEGKDYLTIIDFIGNYSNNFLVPIALYGDTTFNKDRLRRLLTTGSESIPGSSTINFDRISLDKIYSSINNKNFQLKKDLVNDYKQLKFKIGRIPTMMDFHEHGSREASNYVEYSRSYFNFIEEQEDSLQGKLTETGKKILEYFSSDIANGKRIEEVMILIGLIRDEKISKKEFQDKIQAEYKYVPSQETLSSVVNNLNLKFVADTYQGKRVSIGDRFKTHLVKEDNDFIFKDGQLDDLLSNPTFFFYFEDLLKYAKSIFDLKFSIEKYFDGFLLYEKYSRKDVFRILNWKENPIAQNVGGYMLDKEKSNCALFVTYHKDADISATTQYHDHFISNNMFAWMSKSKRTLESPEILRMMNPKGLRIPLFVQKSNDEGIDFYYMGDLTPIENSFEQSLLNGLNVVKVNFRIDPTVDDSIYKYLTAKNSE